MTEKLTEYQNRLISETLCKMVLDGVAPDEIRKKQRFLSEQMTKLNAPSFSENLCSATVAIEDGESVSDASLSISETGSSPLTCSASSQKKTDYLNRITRMLGAACYTSRSRNMG